MELRELESLLRDGLRDFTRAQIVALFKSALAGRGGEMRLREGLRKLAQQYQQVSEIIDEECAVDAETSAQ